MLGKLRKPIPDRDRVVIIDENGTADIALIYQEDDISIYADSASQDYAIPLADLASFVGPHGRIYMLKAESDYVRDTKRLAALEKSIVLRHVTQFVQAKEEASGINIRQILVYALIGVLLLAVVFK